MKIAANIAGGLLGFLFVLGAATFLLGMIPKMDPPPPGSATEHFFAAFMPTGYMTFVKVFELIGGILVAIPISRNFGLLVLGPIILNILAFHVFVGHGKELLTPGGGIPMAIICFLALFLLWVGRHQFLGLLNCSKIK